MEETFGVDTFVVPCQFVREYAGATFDGKNHTLSLSVKKYVPRRQAEARAEGLTIFAAGGNGFPKELYEPLWDDLLSQSERSDFNIKAIWIADMTHQGESGVLNNAVLGDDPSWFDHARDLLQVINHFREDITQPIVGIGHSIGANALIEVALFHPRLISHLILIEPILGDCTREGIFFAHHAINAPHRWPSRSEAESVLRKSPPFSTFDQRVFRRWMKHGLRDRSDGSGGVEVVTSRHQEAVTYVRPLFNTWKGDDSPPDVDKAVESGRNFYCPASLISMRRLPELRPLVLWVFGNRSVMSPAEKQKRILETTGTGLGGSGVKPQSIVFERGGHLIPFENPVHCAEVLVESLTQFSASLEKEQFGFAFTRSTMQVSEAWREHAKSDLDNIATAKRSKL